MQIGNRLVNRLGSSRRLFFAFDAFLLALEKLTRAYAPRAEMKFVKHD